MSLAEFAWRFAESRSEKNTYRHPAVVVLEFGGGSCNKAGSPSCRDFCAVPRGKIYDPDLDPPVGMLADLFNKVSHLKPAIVSIVPNGEGVDSTQYSNTKWHTLQDLYKQGHLKESQVSFLSEYYQEKYETETQPETMTVAEKTALNIALGFNAGLNISLTSNGSFLSSELLKLYHSLGLQTINLSYHPNTPYDPKTKDSVLEHLVTQAENAIRTGITPTITHVLTRQNSDTFVDLADYVSARDIFFAVGIANGKGGSFSTDNSTIEPTDEQLKLVFRRLLARKLFADRHIRTTIPYLLMAPYLRRWICESAPNFFHISVQSVNGELKPQLNVCSEVRPRDAVQLEKFLKGKKLDIVEYLNWRTQAMKDPESGCPTCSHQCFYEADTHAGVNLSNYVELCDYWDTAGKALRLRYISRHSKRPTVSKKIDFQNRYLWELYLQGTTRLIAKLAYDPFWQATYARSGIDFNELVTSFTEDAFNPQVIDQLVEKETESSRYQPEWNDTDLPQSIALRTAYLYLQKSGREANIAIPVKFAHILKKRPQDKFVKEVSCIVEKQQARRHRSTKIEDLSGSIFPMLSRFFSFKTRFLS